jgi:acyl-lipid omega-6 desaturase (Delta-12 desaturase)
MEKTFDQSFQHLMDNWQSIVKKYQKPDLKVAIQQMLTSFLPFIALWVLMYFSLSVSYWLTIGLGMLNAFFVVRIFIIQHDCGHQSFTGSKKLNDIIGFVCSGFSLLPYQYWAKVHNYHHGHCGQLEQPAREIGDLPLLTVEEYKQLSPIRKFGYRLVRMPVILIGILSVYYVVIHNRYISIKTHGFKASVKAMILNNIFFVAIYTVGFLIFGAWTFLKIQLPIIIAFSMIAFFAFYIQHQHEHAYKEWRSEWSYVMAAIKGSSYLKVPKVFQWLLGNINLHHIHHLSSLIPNYNLERCKDENPVLQEHVTILSFSDSLKTLMHKLWDEQQQRMITFTEYRRLYGSTWA